LKKIGSGTLVLAGSNGYGGSTTILAGILDASATAAIPNLLVASPKVTVSAGATLAVGVGGAGQWTTANIDSLRAETGVFASGASLGFDTSGGSFAYNSNISNVGLDLAKLGPNTLVLSGTNTYTGNTVISNGVLDVLNPWSLPNGTNLSVGSAASQLFTAPVVPVASEVVAVPEPGTLVLIVTLASAAWFVRRRECRPDVPFTAARYSSARKSTLTGCMPG
jgi:autotransporter-associated beta strand protein